MITVLNPFVPNAAFLCFQGVEKGCIGNKCVNLNLSKHVNETVTKTASQSLAVTLRYTFLKVSFLVMPNQKQYIPAILE